MSDLTNGGVQVEDGGTRVINRFKQRLKLMKYDHNRLKMKLSMSENLHVLQYNNNNNNNNYDNNKTSSQL